LLKGIGVGSLSQFEEYGGPLLRAHLSAGKGIGGIGCLKGVENADYFLHNLILRRLDTAPRGPWDAEADAGVDGGGVLPSQRSCAVLGAAGAGSWASRASASSVDAVVRR
jgi:hypothetical protein